MISGAQKRSSRATSMPEKSISLRLYHFAGNFCNSHCVTYPSVCGNIGTLQHRNSASPVNHIKMHHPPSIHELFSSNLHIPDNRPLFGEITESLGSRNRRSLRSPGLSLGNATCWEEPPHVWQFTNDRGAMRCQDLLPSDCWVCLSKTPPVHEKDKQ
jgi:hypothetical protein